MKTSTLLAVAAAATAAMARAIPQMPERFPSKTYYVPELPYSHEVPAPESMRVHMPESLQSRGLREPEPVAESSRSREMADDSLNVYNVTKAVLPEKVEEGVAMDDAEEKSAEDVVTVEKKAKEEVPKEENAREEYAEGKDIDLGFNPWTRMDYGATEKRDIEMQSHSTKEKRTEPHSTIERRMSWLTERLLDETNEPKEARPSNKTLAGRAAPDVNEAAQDTDATDEQLNAGVSQDADTTDENSDPWTIMQKIRLLDGEVMARDTDEHHPDATPLTSPELMEKIKLLSGSVTAQGGKADEDLEPRDGRLVSGEFNAWATQSEKDAEERAIVKRDENETDKAKNRWVAKPMMDAWVMKAQEAEEKDIKKRDVAEKHAEEKHEGEVLLADKVKQDGWVME